MVKKKPVKAFNLFREYLLLGKSRNHRAVAENIGRKLYYVQRLGSRWNWTERANAYDTHLLEENKREFEEETKERYKLANKVSLESLKILNNIIEEGNLLDGELDLRNVKLAGDLGAKLIKNESAVELDTTVKNEEKEIKERIDEINKMFNFSENKE